MLSSNCCFLTCYRFLGRKERWSGIPTSVSFPEFAVIHSQRLCMVNKAEVGVFLEFSCFFMIQWMLAIWLLVPLPFLNPVWTYRITQFMYYWRLAWRNYFGSMWYECNCVVVEHSLKSPFFGITIKTTFPVLRPLLSFPNLLAYWVQHFNSIIS